MRVFGILSLFFVNLLAAAFVYIATPQIDQLGKAQKEVRDLSVLTQQLTKVLMTLETSRKTDQLMQSSLAELGLSMNAVDASTDKLKKIFSLQAEKNLEINDWTVIRSHETRIVQEWEHWRKVIAPVFLSVPPELQDIEIASTKVNTKNILLLSLCNDLSLELDASVQQSLRLLRKIQTFAWLVNVLLLLLIAWDLFKTRALKSA